MAYLISLVTVIPLLIFFLAWFVTQDLEYAIMNAVTVLLIILALINVVGVLLYFGILQP